MFIILGDSFSFLYNDNNTYQKNTKKLWLWAMKKDF